MTQEERNKKMMEATTIEEMNKIAREYTKSQESNKRKKKRIITAFKRSTFKGKKI